MWNQLLPARLVLVLVTHSGAALPQMWRCVVYIVRASAAPVVELSSPVVSAKAVKNQAELEGMREAHLRDAVALADFLCWLEAKVNKCGPQGCACV